MPLFADIRAFPGELHRRSALLYYVGIGLSLLFTVFLLSIGFCQNSLSDICHWLKPCKFAISFAAYVAALGWYLEYLKGYLHEKKIQWIKGLTAWLIVAEMVLMLMQAGIDSASYEKLNFSPETTVIVSKTLTTLFDLVIIAITVIAAYVAFYFFKPLSLRPAIYLWGIRTGFFIFMVSSLLGSYMMGKYGQLPADPGNLGLPFADLFNQKNNLLSLHFLGIHYLQIIPFCSYYFHQYIGKKFIVSSAASYIAVCIWIAL